MSELLTVTLTTEEISEVLRVAARDGVWVCNESVQLLCERDMMDVAYCSRLRSIRI